MAKSYEPISASRPIPHDPRGFGETALEMAVDRLELAWTEWDVRGESNAPHVIAREATVRLVPLAETMHWIFSLNGYHRGRGAYYFLERSREPSGRTLTAMTVVRNLVAHHLAQVLSLWWLPLDVPEDWRSHPHRVEAIDAT